VKAVRRHLEALPDTPSSPEAAGDAMRTAVEGAWTALRRRVDERPELEGMGTTLTAATLVQPDAAILTHLGDSRCYRLRSGELERLTADHTWVAREVAAGRLDAEAARVHPRSHILTRAVGTDRISEPEVRVHEARPGDLLLLCTDGLHNLLVDDEIRRILDDPRLRVAEDTPADRVRRRLKAGCKALVDAALEAGGIDNVTVVLAAVRPD
jgi:protein phosphatase